MNRLLSLVAALLMLGGSQSHAQTYWLTPGGSGVNGAVGMCLNASGQAIPVGPACVGSTPVAIVATDPCLNPGVTKSSAAVNMASATTTQIVPLSAGKSVYICGGEFTIAPSATAADTATIEYGTGTNCGTGSTALTGAYGAGDLTTAAPPAVVSLGGTGTMMTAPSGNALCLLSAGTAVSIQGRISYVQQ